MTRTIRIAVYGDVNLNVIDGSSVWLQSMATVLSIPEHHDVTVVLKASETRDLLTGPIRALPRVTVVNPVDRGWMPGPEMSRGEAIDALVRLDGEVRFDAIVLRGFWLCHAAANHEQLAGRLWPYLTDIPQSPEELTEEILARLEQIAEASRFVPCQTEPLRAFLESYVPSFAHKAILLPPMIPDEVPRVADDPAPLAAEETLRIGYVGKHAPLWNTLDMVEVTAELREAGEAVELHVVGDKIHNPKTHPGFHDRMKAALTETDGVVWYEGKPRAEAMEIISTFHVALGWRAAELDDSRELSTKLLEYGAVGVGAIVNRNPMHEALLGADYPLFANDREDFAQAVQAARDPEVRRLARERCAFAASRFVFTAVAEQLAPFFERAAPSHSAPSGKKTLKVLVVSHDLKFFTRIQDHLAALEAVELRVDAWREIGEHDVAESERLLAWADVIICEWCANNAIWYSQRKRPEQRMIVRLHRFELFRRYPHHVKLENVEKVVFVGDHYRDEGLEKLGWPEEKLVVVPNWVDTRLLDRPKVEGAFFNLGMIGIAPMRKRLDRAVEVLAKVRAVDPRFSLYVKTKLPWRYPWIWGQPDEQAHYRDIFRRTNADPLLRGAVHYDGFGPDVASWLRKIGFVLSTSDDESFHLAPAEGMASRALPLLFPWPGADRIYESDWVYEDEDAMAEAILSQLERGDFAERAEQVRTYVEQHYSVEKVCSDWADLVLGDE